MPYIPEYLKREPDDPDLQSIYSAAGTINDNLDAIAGAIASAGGGIQTTTLTGEADSLNTIDGDTLAGGEIATVILGSAPARVARYVLNATSGVPESLPRIVTPLTNPGSKRWELAGFIGYVWEGAGAPTVDDDSDSGIRQGDLWTYDGSAWVCVSDAVGAAVWRSLLTLGTSSITACAGNDARLSDARTPVAHGVAQHTGQACVESQVGFVATGGHAHDGSSSTKVDHANLLNKGSNDHSAIDTFIASATATPAASKIPIADASAHVDGWVSDADATTKGKVQLAGQLGGTAASPTVVGIKESGGQALALGAVSDGQFLKRSGADLIGAAVSGGGGVVNDGIVELNGATSSIRWAGYQITLWSPNDGADVTVTPASTPTLAASANDLDGNALVAAYPYDIFAEYSSATAFTLVAKKWTNSTTRAVEPAMWHGRLRYDNTTDDGKKRLLLCTVYMDTGPAFAKLKGKCFISNLYNPEPFAIGVDNPYSGDTQDAPTPGWEGWNSSSTAFRFDFVLCEERHIYVAASATLQMIDLNNCPKIGVGLDSGSTNSAGHAALSVGAANAGTTGTSILNRMVAPGFHYILPLQGQGVGGSGIIKFYYWSTPMASIQGTILA